MINRILLTIFSLSLIASLSVAQVPIDNYSVSNTGQAQLSIQGQAGKYYMLHAQHTPSWNWAITMAMGVNGTMIISDPAGAYPLASYSVTEHDVATPDDYDGDGIDDVTEFNNMPTDAPINYADPIAFVDGATSVPDAQTFLDLATVNNVGWAPFLDDQLYVKFGILDRDTDQPKVYFINSNTYTIHATFFNSIGAIVNGDDGSGEIVYNPNVINPNGTIGSYSFNFSFGNAYDFEDTQRTYELLAACMPFLQNNLNHFIGQADENQHLNQYADDFVGTRVEVVLESQVFADVDYIPFHEAEGYGFFRHMTDLEETPGSRDIVLYDALPNSLPRVGGIMTSVVQTPLSHVNLRAIQDNVPNAYIGDPLSIDSIANLLNSYVYYKVENEHYEFREATLAEVNAWYEALRPTEPQYPVRDLSITDIMSLDDIEFDMSTAFGAKCSNVATMRTFGFPDGTIPYGFGIPFYYYDEFMQFNNFYEEAQVMIDNPVFQNDIVFRDQRLSDFREDIRDAPMPQWMLDELEAMHNAFPTGTSVRCRSSTNNEDLPGFSGAGLYTSKTQHPDEGHIQKSIKQVYASMWNFRAYEERDFYRVDHFLAAMGVLCHPNFQDEQSNGVGISIDPIYETQGTFYLNTQVGESLITNPDPNSVPEEILLYEDPQQNGGYLVLNLSNLVEPGELVMDQVYLDLMRDYLGVIHDEFASLYDVVGAEGFGMDIEYKVTAAGQLAIKQARPWVSFWADINGDYDLEVEAITEPESSSTLGSNELVSVKIANTGLNPMSNFDLELVVSGQSQETMNITSTIEPFEDAEFQFTVPQNFSAIGNYDVSCIVTHPEDEYANNDTLNTVITKLYALDGAISISSASGTCDNEAEVIAIITNEGDNTITEVMIQVTVNGQVVDVVSESINIPFQDQGVVVIDIDDNLVPTNNNIILNLLSVNGQLDGNQGNNTASTVTSLESDHDIITLVINADDYPGETSWDVIDNSTGVVVASGGVWGAGQTFTEDICVDYNSCFTLNVYDSWGDGICCGFGQGDFEVLDASGTQIVYNNGDFGDAAQEVFCPNSSGCEISASVNVSHTTSGFANDGSITIYTNSGVGPFVYSINGGQTTSGSNSFYNLAPGEYQVYVEGSTGVCTYEETVIIEACEFTNVDITPSHASSVVATDGSIEISPASGVAPFQYSIDGGQSFVSGNFFSGLPVGPYNVVVHDALGICSFEVVVPIEATGNVGIYDGGEAFSDLIRIYPNPTENSFNVEIDLLSTESINIEVFDQLGRTIQTGAIAKGTDTKTTISLDGADSGTYFVKCQTRNAEAHFKVVKL